MKIMEVFELHFNPRNKKGLTFDTFCFEPETAVKKQLGDLYMVGLIKDVNSQNKSLLNELSSLIKTEYYRETNLTSETALKQSLKTVNAFLKELKIGEEQVRFNFFILSCQNSKINFSQIGNLKVLFLKDNKIVNLDEKLGAKKDSFENIISGKIDPKNRIMILNKEVYEFFCQNNILEKIFSVNMGKEIDEILHKFKKAASNLTGPVLLLSNFSPSSLKKITPETKKSKFRKAASFFKLPKINPLFYLQRIRQVMPRIDFSSWGKKFKMSWLSFKKERKSALQKNISLILLLSLILLFGFLLSQKEKEKEKSLAQELIAQIESKTQQADSLLEQKNVQEANLLLQEAWDDILPQTKNKASLEEKAKLLKQKIEEKLFLINNFEENFPFELIFNVPSVEVKLLPQNIILQEQSIYLFNPFSGNLLCYNLTTDKYQQYSWKQNLSLGGVFNKDEVLFFSRPNNIILFKENQLERIFNLDLPYPEAAFEDFDIFRSGLYFLGYNLSNAQEGAVVKYAYLGDLKWQTPQSWLKQKTVEPNSMAIDGSIWILSKNNTISRYYAGQLQETMNLNIFPEPKNISKIFTAPGLPYLYLLEPSQKRIIILDKKGSVIKQLQNSQWDNLLDFAVHEDGKIIYLLNGVSIYKISIK